MCDSALACPDAAVPSMCGLLSVIPSMCAQTHAVMELQQQLPLKAVGACMQLPTQVTGVHRATASLSCMRCFAACELCECFHDLSILHCYACFCSHFTIVGCCSSCCLHQTCNSGFCATRQASTQTCTLHNQSPIASALS